MPLRINNAFRHWGIINTKLKKRGLNTAQDERGLVANHEEQQAIVQV